MIFAEIFLKLTIHFTCVSKETIEDEGKNLDTRYALFSSAPTMQEERERETPVAANIARWRLT